MISVFDHPWNGGLFGDDEIAEIWSPETQLGHLRSFEAALARALGAVGQVPAGAGEAAAKCIMSTEIDLDALRSKTGIDGLPVPEFVRQLRASAGETAEAVHAGATSQDVLDTALALTLRDMTVLLLPRLDTLADALEHLKKVHGTTGLMARTRMQAALPTTVGDRTDAWRRPLVSHREAFETLRPKVERLQLGGAIGTDHAFGGAADAIRSKMATDLHLLNAPVWHTDRTGISDYAGQLSAVTGSIGKLGQDIALMAQQGVDEISISGGGGSSAMPHKSNPVLAELLVTLARFNATLLSGMHQALIHEQERSGAAWMLEWMILPQMAIATGRALSAGEELIGRVERIGQPQHSR